MLPIESHILVVDDVKAIRDWVTNLLKNLGYSHVAQASNGTEALKYVQSHKVDLIFSDIMMPIKSGIEFVRELYAENKYTSIPVILLAAETDNETLLDIATLGVHSYIIKPPTIEALRSKLESLNAS